MKILYTFLFLIFTYSILTNSQLSLQYAFMGLELWFNKMIPTLLPFMILSGVMVRMRLTEGFTTIVYPFVKPLFRVSQNVCYGMIMGFLCGFPMGAKTVQDLFSRQLINKREAEYLLAFCNNIGPVYFIGFVLPLLQRELTVPYVIGMYAIPLLYGLGLRYTSFRDLDNNTNRQPEISSEWQNKRLLNELDEAIHSAIQSILALGGYMVVFNLLNLLPHILLGHPPFVLAPLFEISGGLNLLQQKVPLYALLLLPFGGFSCIAQTYSCIKNTSLSIADYTLHKITLVVLTAIYYLGWYLLSSSSFMR